MIGILAAGFFLGEASPVFVSPLSSSYSNVHLPYSGFLFFSSR